MCAQVDSVDLSAGAGNDRHLPYVRTDRFCILFSTGAGNNRDFPPVHNHRFCSPDAAPLELNCNVTLQFYFQML
jgi:hypothetical protein